MGVFSWLQEALEQHQQVGCEVTPEAEKFVAEYSDLVESSKRSLQARQEQERKERTSATKR
jgi:hypothetical protein